VLQLLAVVTQEARIGHGRLPAGLGQADVRLVEVEFGLDVEPLRIGLGPHVGFDLEGDLGDAARAGMALTCTEERIRRGSKSQIAWRIARSRSPVFMPASEAPDMSGMP
jgi:hypothetical protein